jgi:leucyl-tRNA synthetase
MLSRLQEHIRKATEAMDKLAVRKAIHSVLYELEQDFQWYQKRITAQKGHKKSATDFVHSQVLDAQIRMLTPVAPHLCEELWKMMGEKGFVSLASWPTADESMINIEAEENETLVMDVLEDTLNIMKATGMTPKKIYYYTACSWKWKVYLEMLEKARHGEAKLSEIMKELAAEEDLKKNMKEIANFAQKALKEVNRIPQDRREKVLKMKALDEKAAIEDAKDLLKQRLKAQVEVYDEEDSQRYDPKCKAALSTPFKPAIYIE